MVVCRGYGIAAGACTLARVRAAERCRVEISGPKEGLVNRLPAPRQLEALRATGCVAYGTVSPMHRP